jgi:hypothetical protein
MITSADLVDDSHDLSAGIVRHVIRWPSEAMTIFADPRANIFDDPNHSDMERRELIIGHSAKQRLLVVNFPSGSDESESSAQGERQPTALSTLIHLPNLSSCMVKSVRPRRPAGRSKPSSSRIVGTMSR